VFCLPDNIERSLQRTNSTALIKQLRVLSSSDLEAAKYDRERWRAQVLHTCFCLVLSKLLLFFFPLFFPLSSLLSYFIFIFLNLVLLFHTNSWGLFWSYGSK
jgi:hypothetical protein